MADTDDIAIPDARPTDIELHIGTSTEFTERAWSRRVRALGGSYTKVLGYSECRIVTVPNTPEGREMADKLIRRFRYSGTCVILRGITVSGFATAPNIVYTLKPGQTVADCFFTHELRFATWWKMEGEAAARREVVREKIRERVRREEAPGRLSLEVAAAIARAVTSGMDERDARKVAELAAVDGGGAGAVSALLAEVA